MRYVLVLLAALMAVPGLSYAGPKKHGQPLKELAHKKRVKKAARQDPGAARHFHKRGAADE